MIALTLPFACVVCHGSQADVTRKASNGLPAGVAICSECVDAIQRRQVGISRLASGELSITDGRQAERVAVSA
jgi:hypothetical protein